MTLPPKMMKRFKKIVAEATSDVLDKLDILSGSKPQSQSFTTPVLSRQTRDAMEQIDDIGRITAVTAYARTPAEMGLPSTPPRVILQGVNDSLALPQSLWETLISEGWIDSCGVISAQYIRASSG